jgi:hypothetical protein
MNDIYFQESFWENKWGKISHKNNISSWQSYQSFHPTLQNLKQMKKIKIK